MKSLVSDEVFVLPRELPAACLEGAVLLPNRFAIIDRLPRGGRVAEIGTQRGEFAKYILTIADPSELHLFDIDFRPNALFDFSWFAGPIDEGRVVLHQGDSSFRLSQFPDHFFEWIYIDGDHSFEGVVKDIEQSVRKVRPDGYLIFNDYTIYSPVEQTQYGVQRAVNELVINGGYLVKYFALSISGYPDICIQRAP